MTETYYFVVFVIALALFFDFLNGFHDAANAIATIVVTKTLKPYQAVILAGLANFFGYFIFGVAIAKMVGKGVIRPEYVTLTLLLSALSGAIIWNIITWLLGLPTSSSHALIGGLVGAALAGYGAQAIIPGGVLRIVVFIFIAPILGMLGAVFFTTLIMILFRKSNPAKANSLFKKLQLISAASYSLGHGTNDAQKTMGIIALALFAGGVHKTFHIEPWIVFSCHAAIGLGTMFGGWRIVKTMGTQITKIHAMEGFCAETSSAIVLLLTAHFGIPVSTTHVIAGSIMGVGAVEQASKVRWVTARRIIWAWFLTIPLTGICAYISYIIFSFFIKN